MGGTISSTGCCCAAASAVPPPPAATTGPGSNGAPGSSQQAPPPPSSGQTAQQPVGQLSSAAQALKGAGEVQGIDVSHWQGTIDWAKVKQDDVKVAYLKASESTDYRDDTYERNRREAAAQGIITGAYHFAKPSTDGGSVAADARAEAQHFLATADVKVGDLAPVLDLEDAGKLDKQQLSEWVGVWADTVRGATGVQPVIYTSPSFWNSKVGDAAAAKDFRLWIAHWGTDSPTVPGDWQAWSGWQYTSDGSVDGIKGRVDRDRIKDPYSLIIGG